MIKRYHKLLIILILFSVFLTGCWDYLDIDKRSIVISIGVDKVKDNIEFSGEVAKLLPEMGERGGSPQGTNVYTDLSYGKTFEEARIDFNRRRPHPTFLGATRVVVFGSNLAQEGIEPYLNRINKTYDYRKTLLAVVSREPPNQIFATSIENDLSVGFLIENTVNFLAKNGSALYKTIGEMLSDIALNEVGYVLPYIGIDKRDIKYLGLAVMKDSKLVGTIDIKDSDGLLYLLAKNPLLTEVMTSPKNEENKISFKTSIKNRKIKTKYVNKKIVINISLDLNARLRYQYFIEPISSGDIKQLETMISNKVKKDIENILERTQEDYECDILGFARYFRADNSTVYKQIKWSEEYPKAEINVSVNTKIINQNLSDPNAEKKE
ncbi:Ger(x)C family spore germination protein [Clostridium aestuarii]|uniref:Ger(X)C family spore germination protein n=1 Tax=Clostridium aestuarii TaxID=338193 RepID=A0ABT4CYL7_9CLOT|nr:Ger(x)C family spore germination protein [Clostridium aestuarii]MCY6484082.1 Ger(x)C family spore germination protein [Clostridium aestuarii]